MKRELSVVWTPNMLVLSVPSKPSTNSQSKPNTRITFDGAVFVSIKVNWNLRINRNNLKLESLSIGCSFMLIDHHKIINCQNLALQQLLQLHQTLSLIQVLWLNHMKEDYTIWLAKSATNANLCSFVWVLDFISSILVLVMFRPLF